LDGLHRLRNDIRPKALIVVLFVLTFLFVAAFFALPAQADLLDAVGAVVDQASDVVEDTTTTVIENVASGVADSATAAVEEIVVEVIPPDVVEAVDVLEDVLPVVDDVLEVVGDTPPVVEDVFEVVEIIPPVVEDLLVVVDVAPIEEIVEEVVEVIPPVVEIVDEVLPVVADVVTTVSPQLVDVVVLPLFVPAVVAIPGPIEIPTNPVTTTSNTPEVSLNSEPTKGEPRQLSGLFTQELVAEMSMFHLADLSGSSTATGSSASPVPAEETPGLAGYVPIGGPVPVVGSAGSSTSSGSSHIGSSFSGGLDAFSFFAAMAALLALCLVGWIRDRSRSGRSIFPSHGGRPG